MDGQAYVARSLRCEGVAVRHLALLWREDDDRVIG